MQEWYFFTVHLLGSEQTKLLEADMLGNNIFHFAFFRFDKICEMNLVLNLLTISAVVEF